MWDGSIGWLLALIAAAIAWSYRRDVVYEAEESRAVRTGLLQSQLALRAAVDRNQAAAEQSQRQHAELRDSRDATAQKQQDVARLAEKLENKNVENNQLKKQVAAANKLAFKRECLENDKSILRQQNQQLEQRLGNTASAHDQEVRNLRADMAAAEAAALAQLHSAEQEAAVAAESAHAFQQQLAASQAQLAQAKTDLQSANSAIVELPAQHTKELQGLQQQLAEAHAGKEQMETKLQKAQHYHEHAQSQLQIDITRIRQQCAAEVQQQVAKLKELESCKANLSAQLLEEQGCRGEADLQIEQLEAQQSSFTATVNQMQQQMHDMEAANAQLKQQLSEQPSQVDVDGIVAERNSLTEQLRHQAEHANDTASQLQQAHTDLQEQCEHLERLQNEHDQVVLLLAERTGEIDALQEQHESTQDAFKAAQGYLAEVESDHKQHLEGLQAQVDGLQAELAEAHDAASTHRNDSETQTDGNETKSVNHAEVQTERALFDGQDDGDQAPVQTGAHPQCQPDDNSLLIQTLQEQLQDAIQIREEAVAQMLRLQAELIGIQAEAATAAETLKQLQQQGFDSLRADEQAMPNRDLVKLTVVIHEASCAIGSTESDARLQQETASLREELEKERDNASATLSRLQAELVGAQLQADAAADAGRQLQQQYDNAQAVHEQSVPDREQMQVELEDTRTELAAANTQAKVLLQMCVDLQKQQQEELKQAKEAHESDRRAAVQQLKAEVSSLEAQVAASSSVLQEKVKAARSAAEAAAAARSAQEVATAREGFRHKARKAAADKEAAVTRLEEAQARFEHDEAELKAKVQELQTHCDAVTQDREAAVAELEGAQAKFSTERDALKGQLEQVQKEYELATGERDAAVSGLKQAQASFDCVEADLKEQLQDFQTDCEVITKDRDALQQVIHEQLAAHGVLKKELSESHTVCASLKKQVDQLNEDREAQIGSSRSDYGDQLLSARNSPAAFEHSHGKLQLQDSRSLASSPSRGDLSSLFAAADSAHINGSAPRSQGPYYHTFHASTALSNNAATLVSSNDLHDAGSMASPSQPATAQTSEAEAATHAPTMSLQLDTAHAIAGPASPGATSEQQASTDQDADPASVTAVADSAHSSPGDNSANSNKENTPARLDSGKVPGVKPFSSPGPFLTVKTGGTGRPGVPHASNGHHESTEVGQEAGSQSAHADAFTAARAVTIEDAHEVASDSGQCAIAEDGHNAPATKQGISSTEDGNEAAGNPVHSNLAAYDQDAEAADDIAVATKDASQASSDYEPDPVEENEEENGIEANLSGSSAVAAEEAYEAASDEILGDGEASEHTISRQSSLASSSIAHTPPLRVSEGSNKFGLQRALASTDSRDASHPQGTRLRLTPPGSPAMSWPDLSQSRKHHSSASVGSSSSTPGTLRHFTEGVQSQIGYDLSVGSMFDQHPRSKYDASMSSEH